MSKKNLVSIGVALGASLAMSNASAITVAGVTWDENSSFDFSTQQSLFENNVNAAGETLTFYGQVDKVNALGDFCTGCSELTFVGTYDVLTVGDFDGNGQIDVVFGNGALNVYADDGTGVAFDPLSSASAGDGVLFAQLSGHTQTVLGNDGDLFAELDGGLVLAGSNDSGSGFGAWDVIGGAAASFLDTNTKVDGADFTYTTSFQPVDPEDPDNTDIFGTAELKGDSVTPMPEPSILGLLGIGLLGFGAARRKSAR